MTTEKPLILLWESGVVTGADIENKLPKGKINDVNRRERFLEFIG
jgi:hypothetical protein